MSKIINDALDQYGVEPFEQQQFGTSGIEGVKESTDGAFLTNSGRMFQTVGPVVENAASSWSVE